MSDLFRLVWEQTARVVGPWLFGFLDWLGGVGLAFALWLTGLYDLAVGAWVPAKYAALLLSPRFHTAPLVIPLIVGCLILRIWAKSAFKPRVTRPDGTVNRRMRVRRQPWRRRLKLWWVHKFDQPWYWRLQKGVVANLNQTHGLVVGGSGSGKSTLVVELILQPAISLTMRFMRRIGRWQKRKVLIVSFDRSDPIEEATNVVEDAGVPVTRWRVRQGHGWNLLDGDVEMIAEALPEGWSKTADDTGFFRQLASDSIAAALREMDDEGIGRDFNDLVERVDRIMAADDEIPELARKTWVRRFRSLARVMGDSLGDDFNLVDVLSGEGPGVVHLSSNSYTNPAITPLVGAMAITHIKLAAEQVDNVYLVLEEASFLKNRSNLLDDLARSLRARGWRIVYLNQDPGSVGDALQINFGVAVFMGLGPLAQSAREWCASVVKGFPGAFQASELVLGATIDALEGYVLLNGRCREISFAPYITRAAEHRPAGGPRRRQRWTMTEVPWDQNGHGDADENNSGGTEPRDLTGRDWTVPLWALGQPGQAFVTMPRYYAEDAVLSRYWAMLSDTDQPDECWLIPKDKTNGAANRAKVWVPSGQCLVCEPPKAEGHYETGYVRSCVARNGPKPADPDGTLKWNVDHVCHTEDLTCPGGNRCEHRRCMNGDQQRWVTAQVNQVRSVIRKQRRTDWLAGVQTRWETTVAEEADQWIAEHEVLAS